MKIPICSDCKMNTTSELNVNYCTRTGLISPVLGGFLDCERCRTERAPFLLSLRFFSNRCGPEGRHFIAKD